MQNAHWRKNSGLLHAMNQQTFTSIKEDIEEYLPACTMQTSRYSSQMMDKVYNHVCLPNWILKRKSLFTNNNAESLNYVIKDSIKWTPCSPSKLIEHLRENINIHYMDIKKSLYNSGNFKIPGFKTIDPIIWQNYTENKRNDIFCLS